MDMDKSKEIKTIKEDNFWQGLDRPFFALAPMSDVTDEPFRRMIAKYSGIDSSRKDVVLWTEFVSADGLCSRGREHLMHILKYSESERPIVAQIFGSNIANLEATSRLVAELGFDGVDINMGCPDKSIEKQGAGAGMIKTPEVALEAIRAMRRGVESAVNDDKTSTNEKGANKKSEGKKIPVSVKTRLGYNEIDLGWIETLLSEKPDALTVHLRTRKEMSEVPAKWDLMKEVVELRNKISPETIVLGNGDVTSLDDARVKVLETGCDGVMIGRGIFGNPWFFSKKAVEITPRMRLEVMLEHTRDFEEILGGVKGVKNFAVMKKHYKAYVSGWDGAKELRIKLMETENAGQVEGIVKSYLENSLD